MLITSGYPLSMQVDQTAGQMILDELLRHGLNVQVGVSVRAFEGNGSVQAAVTETAAGCPATWWSSARGYCRRMTFIPRDRIEVDLGVVVDEHLQTSAAGIYAAGDVAECVDIARQMPLGQRHLAGSRSPGTCGRNQYGRPTGGLPGQPKPQRHARVRPGCA